MPIRPGRGGWAECVSTSPSIEGSATRRVPSAVDRTSPGDFACERRGSGVPATPVGELAGVHPRASSGRPPRGVWACSRGAPRRPRTTLPRRVGASWCPRRYEPSGHALASRRRSPGHVRAEPDDHPGERVAAVLSAAGNIVCARDGLAERTSGGGRSQDLRRRDRPTRRTAIDTHPAQLGADGQVSVAVAVDIAQARHRGCERGGSGEGPEGHWTEPTWTAQKDHRKFIVRHVCDDISVAVSVDVPSVRNITKCTRVCP